MIFITKGIKLEENVRKINESERYTHRSWGGGGGGRGEEAGSPSSPLALFIDTQLRPATALIKKIL